MGGCLELLEEWCGVRGRGLSRLWDELLGGGLGPGVGLGEGFPRRLKGGGGGGAEELGFMPPTEEEEEEDERELPPFEGRVMSGREGRWERGWGGGEERSLSP